jgi:hypothetical protein
VPRLLRPHTKSNGSKETSNSVVLVAPASHKIDPFNSLPVDGGGDTQYLLSGCEVPAAFSLSASPIDNSIDNQIVYILFYPTDRPYSTVRPSFGEVEIYQKCLHDSATLHIILAEVAMVLSRLSSIDLGYNVASHFSQAIAIANKRIANFHCEPITHKDCTIMVVHNLIQFEVRTLSVSTSFVSIANTTILLGQFW